METRAWAGPRVRSVANPFRGLPARPPTPTSGRSPTRRRVAVRRGFRLELWLFERLRLLDGPAAASTGSASTISASASTRARSASAAGSGRRRSGTQSPASSSSCRRASPGASSSSAVRPGRASAASAAGSAPRRPPRRRARTRAGRCRLAGVATEIVAGKWMVTARDCFVTSGSRLGLGFRLSLGPPDFASASVAVVPAAAPPFLRLRPPREPRRVPFFGAAPPRPPASRSSVAPRPRPRRPRSRPSAVFRLLGSGRSAPPSRRRVPCLSGAVGMSGRPARRRLPRRLLGLALRGQRLGRLLAARGSRRVGAPSSTRSTRTFTLLPTCEAASATTMSSPSSFPTAAAPSYRSTSTSWSMTSASSATGAGGARSASLPSARTTKWSRCVVRLPFEEEALLRDRLELDEPPRAGTDERARDRIGELDPERLAARARGERAQPPLDVDSGRSLGVDDPVAAAGRAFARHDLARPVGDVLARHLDEPERRDLDDVRLRPVALELCPQRLLDGRAVLRVRHVDEVDDDDPADVAQPQLADDLLHGLEVVLRDRVLEPAAGVLSAPADEAPGVDVDDGERLGVVEDQIAAGGEIDAAARSST